MKMTSAYLIPILFLVAGCSTGKNGLGMDITPKLFQSIEKGQTDLLDSYLAQGGSPDLYTMSNGYLIRFAAFYENLDAVRKLIAAGATVDAKLPEESTTLTYAILNSRCVVARLLLSAGASPYEKLNDAGEMALDPRLQGMTALELYLSEVRGRPAIYARDQECWNDVGAVLTRRLQAR